MASKTVQLAGLTLPHRKQEAWKYTDLSRLLPGIGGRTDAPATAPLTPPDDALYLRFEDLVLAPPGELPQGLFVTQANALPAGLNDGLDPLRQNMPGSTVTLKITADQPKMIWLDLRHPGTAGQWGRLSLTIELAPDVHASLAEAHSGGAGGISIVDTGLKLAQGAHLQHLRMQYVADEHALLGSQQTELARDARLMQTHCDWGGRLSRLHSHIRLTAPQARVDLHALAMLAGHAHVDHQVLIDHAAPDAVSRLHSRGIVADRSKQVFCGKVLVRRDAQRTDSDQQLRNLLLDDQAEVDARPELEIYADDVRCAHGSAVGRLDEAALFYLRSRGLDKTDARHLLIQSFGEPILATIPDPALRARLRDNMADRLPWS